MAVQLRAEVTRQAIMEAAVDQFNGIGYGNTTLADIISRAGITKGAFYYHFDTKESVAAAVIEEAEGRKSAAIVEVVSSVSPAFEKLIRLGFTVADGIRRDKLIRAGHLLRQSLNQVSQSGPRSYVEQPRMLAALAEVAIAEGDLRSDLDANDFAQAGFAAILGSHLLAGAIGDDVCARMAQIWRVMMPGIVAPEAVGYWRQFVARLEQRYVQPN